MTHCLVKRWSGVGGVERTSGAPSICHNDAPEKARILCLGSFCSCANFAGFWLCRPLRTLEASEMFLRWRGEKIKRGALCVGVVGGESIHQIRVQAQECTLTPAAGLALRDRPPQPFSSAGLGQLGGRAGAVPYADEEGVAIRAAPGPGSAQRTSYKKSTEAVSAAQLLKLQRQERVRRRRRQQEPPPPGPPRLRRRGRG